MKRLIILFVTVFMINAAFGQRLIPDRLTGTLYSQYTENGIDFGGELNLKVAGDNVESINFITGYQMRSKVFYWGLTGNYMFEDEFNPNDWTPNGRLGFGGSLWFSLFKVDKTYCDGCFEATVTEMNCYFDAYLIWKWTRQINMLVGSYLFNDLSSRIYIRIGYTF